MKAIDSFSSILFVIFVKKLSDDAFFPAHAVNGYESNAYLIANSWSFLLSESENDSIKLKYGSEQKSLY